ncbi:MAG: IS1182 family transposase [Chloroflexota bacterium]
MSLGPTPRQGDVFRDTTEFCAPRVRTDSIYALLRRECFDLFPDELFSDLFADIGRRSVPPLVVAVVMVLQRLEGLSDREAVERFTFDARWKYAAGGLPFDYPGFAHTVLVDMRARLARSERPKRIFERSLEVARDAGLVGVRRVLDSTPLYDAVATMDTVSLVRSAIRGVLAAAPDREPQLRAVLRRDDDYRTGGKPACDWEDAEARLALVDALARDGQTLLEALEGSPLPPALGQAATLLATVLGQDLEDGPDGRIRIARRVAPDRVISTVDPDARHGHKTDHRSFDGYKGHVALDPDAELVTATAVTPGNAGDASVVPELLADELAAAGEPEPEPVTVYGDSAYGAGPVLAALDRHGVVSRVKVQSATGVPGHFTKDDFAVDLVARTVICPAGRTAPLIRHAPGFEARFRSACTACPLAARCTSSPAGRRITVGPHEAHLALGRAATRDPAWRADYRATRPKVERKLAHLMRRRHGGRRVRVRGRLKVGADFALLAAAANLARLAVLGLTGSGGTWAIRPA